MKTTKKEIRARSVLSTTGIPGMKYCVNPYIGCAHRCVYCYATFMKRFTGHTEKWGSFVDIKINACEVLRRQLKGAKKGGIILSSVTDPYQPAEAAYGITRKCLEALALYHFPVSILTKSPLVVRDTDIISRLKEADVGITITTDNERIRGIFEPGAPPVQARLDALHKLHRKGIQTYVFIGPVLPMNPKKLAHMIRPCADSILIDRLNYPWKVTGIYKKYRLESWLQQEYIDDVIYRLQECLSGKTIDIC